MNSLKGVRISHRGSSDRAEVPYRRYNLIIFLVFDERTLGKRSKKPSDVLWSQVPF